MLLHTPLYLIFLALAVSVYWALPRTNWRRNWLLAASYGFYAAFDPRFALLLAGLTLGVFFLGRAIPASSKPHRLAWLSAGLCLGSLGLFKYADFFVTSAAAALEALGVSTAPPALRLLLPLGISFYTFQAVAYTTEIYRGRMQPAASLWDLALYLAYFPKLIAGPLARPQAFLEPAAEPPARPDGAQMRAALQLLLVGLFKKLVIADSLASLGETAFRAAGWPEGGSFAAPLYWQGFYLYAFLIYADFSGYTDIARASARLLGHNLPENFRQPYLAATLTDFWNRWHMSLTQWFREYLYFPVARGLLARLDRRHAGAVQAAATFFTMLVIGLWHGAAWTYVAWGAWHGMWLTLERWVNYRPAGRWSGLAAGVATFHVVGLGWVLFGAGSFGEAARFAAGIFSLEQWQWLSHYAPPVALTAGLVFGLDLAAGERWREAQERWRPVLAAAAVVALLSLAALGWARGAETRPFIYGQF